MSEQLGKPMLRKEDASLLSGRGRYADDLPVAVGTLCRPRHPLAACPRRNRAHRCGARAGA